MDKILLALEKEQLDLLMRLLQNSPISGSYKDIKENIGLFEETEKVLSEGLEQIDEG